MADVLSAERRGRVTGSRIAGILDLSPYRNRRQVMREMVREHFWEPEEFTGNVATEWGKEHEADAVEEYQLKTGKTLSYTGLEQQTFVDADRRLAVTPDGVEKLLVHRKTLKPIRFGTTEYLDEKDQHMWRTVGAAEFKAPYRALYTSIDERADYQQQCHLIAEILGLSEVDFGVWRPSGFNVTTLHHDESWWPTVADEVEKFLTEYDQVISSEELAAPYLIAREGERIDEEWSGAVAEYLDLTAEQKRISENLGQVRNELIRLAGAETNRGAGLQLIYRRPPAAGKGSIKYKDVVEELFDRFDIPAAERKQLTDKHRGPKPDLRATWAFKLYDQD